MSTNAKRISITMTERAPVSIDPSEWSVIARAKWYSGEHECQANEVAKITVRQRGEWLLISAARDSGPGGQYAGYEPARAGYLLDGANQREVIATIREAANAIDHPGLAAECIADLPAEEI